MSNIYQKYMDPEVVNKIDNLSLRARLVVEGFIIGMHKSPYHGFSVEFSEHRPYGFGDEIKYIDWKLWGKTDRFYIKQFEEETNLKCHMILDKSSSMNFSSSNITKFDYSKSLSAALTYLMIKQQDAIGLTTFDEKIDVSINPKSKISHLNLLLKTMHNAKPGGETNISHLLLPDGMVYVELPDGEGAEVEGKEREEFLLGHVHIFSAVSFSLLALRSKLTLLRMERLREPSGKYTLRGIMKPNMK